jgi:glycosyltransferase involved in cell wall biosynthesis
MRIAIFSDNFYPEMSGISDSIILIAKGLAQKGHHVNFYVPRYSKKNFLISKLKPEELELHENIGILRLPSIPYPFAPTKQGRFALPFFASFSHLKKFDPDAIYTQDFFSAGLEALIVSRLLKKPLIGTSHTPITEFLKYAPFHFRWMDRLMLKYVSWYYNRCLMVSAPSRSILNEMIEYGFSKDHQVISNPINLDGFYPVENEEEKQALKKKFGLSDNTVLYTGRLGEEKKIDDIIRAVKLAKEKIPGISLAITGHGHAEKSLKRLSKELGLEKNIHFFGYVEPEIFTLLYQASDIFAVMSTAETQCMSMMQAMATRLPVIGAASWGVAEYIHPRNGYLVPPGDFEELSRKIIYLFENPAEIERLGSGGEEYVKNFSLEIIVREWEEIFQEAIRNNHLL